MGTTSGASNAVMAVLTVPVLPTRVGGSVPTVEEDAEAGFDPDRATPPKEQKKMDPNDLSPGFDKRDSL